MLAERDRPRGSQRWAQALLAVALAMGGFGSWASATEGEGAAPETPPALAPADQPADRDPAPGDGRDGDRPEALERGSAQDGEAERLAIELEAAQAEAARRQAYGAGIDPVGDKLSPWPPYGAGNYRPPSTGKFYGRLRSQLRHEWGDVPSAAGRNVRDRDTDFLQTLILGTDGLGHERLDTRFHGRWSKDLDGTKDPLSGRDFFIDARDTQYHQRHLFEIYSAYARYRGFLDAVDVTVGRQYVTEVDWVHFDGVAFDAPRLGDLVSVGAFLGRRVNFYRREFDDRLVTGGHVILHATDRIDVAISNVYSARNLLELKVVAEPIDGLLITPSARFVDEEFDQMRLDVDYWNTDLGLEARFTYLRQFTGSDGLEFGLASADDNFEQVRLRLPEPSAFHQFHASVYKELVAKHLGVQVGLIRHWVQRRGSQTGWEASYWEPWVAIDLADVPIPGLRFDARFTYADYHRPRVFGVDEVFQDTQRAEGEKSWFEVQVGGRYRVAGLVTVGASYIYREFRSTSAFFRNQRFNQNGGRAFARLELERLVPGLSAQVEYRIDEDLLDPADGLQRSEALWAHVEYAF